jgi:hypothetical protein
MVGEGSQREREAIEQNRRAIGGQRVVGHDAVMMSGCGLLPGIGENLFQRL